MKGPVGMASELEKDVRGTGGACGHFFQNWGHFVAIADLCHDFDLC
jgi:hypothetical protein